MTKHKLGLVSISFRDCSPEQILHAMKEARLTYIEWGSDIHAPCNDIERLNHLSRLQKEMGIECCSYGTYFWLGVTPIEELPAYIKAARVLGTDVIRLWCGNKNSQEYSPEEKQALFNDCKVAAKLAEQEGVTLCMECHNNTYTNITGASLELMATVNSKHFRMYWQPNQFRSRAYNLSSADLLAPFVKRVHVFNWLGDEKFCLDEAVDVWKDYLANFDNAVLLLEFMPDGKIESLKTEAAALFKIAEA